MFVHAQVTALYQDDDIAAAPAGGVTVPVFFLYYARHRWVLAFLLIGLG